MLIRLLWYNTFLIEGAWPGNVGRYKAPWKRAHEIGAMLSDLITRGDVDHTIVALCEVFGQRHQHTIAEQISNNGSLWRAHGPPAGEKGIEGDAPRWLKLFAKHVGLPVDSGLMTMSGSLPILRTEREAFGLARRADRRRSCGTWLNRGHPLRDPDFWANKGILLTEFDLGFGGLELYTTHLYAGEVFGEVLINTLSRWAKSFQAGGEYTARWRKHLEEVISGILHAGPWSAWFEIPAAQRNMIQQAQLKQLNSFIRRHHSQGNLVVIAGDFNIDANSEGLYALLRDHLHELAQIGIELEDVWLTAHGYEKSFARPTTVMDERRVYGQKKERQEEVFSDELHKHLDYVFIQQSSAIHTFDIDVISARLHHFPRKPRRQAIQFLSDHLALELELSITPLQALR